jgi:hypothetical protein
MTERAVDVFRAKRVAQPIPLRSIRLLCRFFCLRLRYCAFFVCLFVILVNISDKAIPHRQLFAINKGREVQANGGSGNILQIIIVGKLRTSANLSAINSTNVSPPPSMVQERIEMFAMLHHTSTPWPIDQTTAHRNQCRTVDRDLARSEDRCEGLE